MALTYPSNRVSLLKLACINVVILFFAIIFDSQILRTILTFVFSLTLVDVLGHILVFIVAFRDSYFNNIQSTRSLRRKVIIGSGIVLFCLLLCAGASFLMTLSMCHGHIACAKGYRWWRSHDQPLWQEFKHVNITYARGLEDTVVVTAASAIYYKILENMIASVQFWEPDMHIVLWDLGLTEQQLRLATCWRNVR
jgi:hypothetical protein